jgi:predicted ATPase
VKTSVDHGFIFYNFEKTMWDWDESQITKLEISDNIVEYLIETTLRNTLREENIELLKVASCLSTREFNTFILSEVVGLTPVEVITLCFRVFDCRSLADCGLP